MAFGASITVVNRVELNRRIKRLNIGKRRPAMRKMLVELGRLTRDNVRKEILTRTGPPLPHRLTNRTGRGRRSIKFKVLANQMEVGTDLGYMIKHEPTRPFLEPGVRKSRRKVETVLRRHLKRVIETA